MRSTTDKTTLLIAEAARELRIRPSQVRRCLPVTLVGGRPRILRSQLDKYLTENTTAPAPRWQGKTLAETPAETLARLQREGRI